jgi:hypothetical protein
MALDPTFDTGPISPVPAGVTIAFDARKGVTPASQACGMFIAWVP